MNRTVLISGGSRGIGEACVRRFAGQGDRVIFLYRSSGEKAEALVRELREKGQDVACLCCDVADPAAVRKTAEQILGQYHRVDVLVNNAGVAWLGLFTDMTDEELDRVLNTDLRGSMLLTRAILPGMVSQKNGCIVNIASMWGETGASCEVAYSAAKAGLIGFTKALAKEVGPSGIRVNCVSPGVIDTEMNRRSLTENDLAALAEETPLCRIGTPEETAAAVAWLASPEASFITGQVLGVNGGMVV